MRREDGSFAQETLRSTMKVFLVSLGLATLAVALRVEGWQVFLAVVGGALMGAAFYGVPSRLVAYVAARRGTGYQAFFSIAVPLMLTAAASYGVWFSVYVGALLGDWLWTDIAAPVLYGVTAIINIAVLIMNAQALRRGAAG